MIKQERQSQRRQRLPPGPHTELTELSHDGHNNIRHIYTTHRQTAEQTGSAVLSTSQ